MGTIVHAYDPNIAVYVIDECEKELFVKAGTVIRVRTESLVSGVEILYDIRLSGNSGTAEFEEADVFVDKPTAIAEYDVRIG